MALRCEMRRHRASFVIAAVIVAVAAGAVMTAAAGARRSDNVYARFLNWSHAPDLFSVGGDDKDIPHDLAALEHAPFAESVAHTYAAGAHVRTRAGEDVPASSCTWALQVSWDLALAATAVVVAAVIVAFPVAVHVARLRASAVLRVDE